LKFTLNQQLKETVKIKEYKELIDGINEYEIKKVQKNIEEKALKKEEEIRKKIENEKKIREDLFFKAKEDKKSFKELELKRG